MVERDRESLMSSEDAAPPSLPSSESISEGLAAQKSVDMLFDRLHGKSSWEPARPPEALGEFLDSTTYVAFVPPIRSEDACRVAGQVVQDRSRV
jgi:hypothetical protein